MKWAPDRTGRFAQRPYWPAAELDAYCERTVTRFLEGRHGVAAFPISTDDVTVMIEADTEDLDTFADLDALGDGIQGVTFFHPGRRPIVKVQRSLAADPRHQNRYRTTLTHEYGHVLLHRSLWDSAATETLFGETAAAEKGGSSKACRQERILAAPAADWMEWQAAFASGALLMPGTRVAALVAEFQRQAGRVGPVAAGSKQGHELTLRVEQQFHVSAEAAHVRLTVLRHLDQAAQPETGLLSFGR